MQATSSATTQAMPLPIKRSLDNFCCALFKAYARLQLASATCWYVSTNYMPQDVT